MPESLDVTVAICAFVGGFVGQRINWLRLARYVTKRLKPLEQKNAQLEKRVVQLETQPTTR